MVRTFQGSKDNDFTQAKLVVRTELRRVFNPILLVVFILLKSYEFHMNLEWVSAEHDWH